jgi:hypothetical protein
MALRAFVVVSPRDPLVAKLVRGLLAMRKDGRWPNTQATSWALRALDDARPLFEPKTTGTQAASLAIDEDVFGRAAFSGKPGGEAASGTIPIAKLLAAPGSALAFATRGADRPLYYEGVLRVARRDPPKESLDRGLHVARVIHRLGPKGDLLPLEPLHVGDYVAVDVLVATATGRELVVLDDPIPAGFEPVNQRFANADRRPLVEDPAGAIVTERELHDDRVLTFFDELSAGAHVTRYLLRVSHAGRFALPPAKAECMYAPDVFGRTSASVIEVK